MDRIVHTPVLLEEVISFLLPYQDETVVDATVGEGGHSEAILSRVKPSLLVAVDRDMEILQKARERLSGFPSVKFIYGNFSELSRLLKKEGIDEVSAVLMDLGISSFHLETPERGFSFLSEGPLDMRLDRVGEKFTAYEVVNSFSEKRLCELIREFGEERWAKRIARAIVQRRKEAKIKSTKELAEVVASAIPKRYWPKRLHPATRTFQAIRIAVNYELDSLKSGLKSAFEVLKPGGRIVVISFHSLEDRIVKHTFRSFEKKGLGRVLTKKPVLPSDQELKSNPRARSAKMRVFEKDEG
ncbi:MAG: 16S rRNA (cytosine(1402)-N(4))-methyltransferase RsmH [Deferribacteres bacterium]|nr:16S rRNA (cytosine(1402)-N(4))-methyltransferase RsmH [Deferribacteres bacterium]